MVPMWKSMAKSLVTASGRRKKRWIPYLLKSWITSIVERMKKSVKMTKTTYFSSVLFSHESSNSWDKDRVGLKSVSAEIMGTERRQRRSIGSHRRQIRRHKRKWNSHMQKYKKDRPIWAKRQSEMDIEYIIPLGKEGGKKRQREERRKSRPHEAQLVPLPRCKRTFSDSSDADHSIHHRRNANYSTMKR